MKLDFHAMAASAAALALMGACSGGTDGGDEANFEDYPSAQIIIDDFADQVVVATYSELAERLGALHTATQAFIADPIDANLTAAQQAWVAAREPWEASEGFLFGPVDSLGLDPALDSWPVDRNALDEVLAGNVELTPVFVANLDTTLRGFHTAEYLLFGVGGSKTAADFDQRQFDYLSSVASLLAEAGTTLADSWITGVDGGMPYTEVFKGAGNNPTYPSLTSAAEEIVRGTIGIADEVANGKIADPFDQQDATLVESQFAFNSLTDFKNNIRSIRNAYTGDAPVAGTTGAGLDEFVASIDPALAARVVEEIDAALEALEAVPEPFLQAITDPEAADEITAAQEAIRTVQTTLESEILPLII